MEIVLSDYQKHQLERKLKQQALDNEPWQVLLKLPSQPHNLRVTYSKYKGGRVTEIEEINTLENKITSCKFRGRSSEGDCPKDIVEIKPLINSVKPSEWIVNTDYYIDSFKKQH